MKPTKSRIASIATPVVAFLLGSGITCVAFILVLNPNKELQPVDPVGSQPTNGNVANTEAHGATSDVSVPTGAPIEALRSIHDIVSFRSPFDRGLALRNVLARSNERHVLDLLAESLELPNHSNSLELQSDIIHRLAQIDPSKRCPMQ